MVFIMGALAYQQFLESALAFHHGHHAPALYALAHAGLHVSQVLLIPSGHQVALVVEAIADVDVRHMAGLAHQLGKDPAQAQHTHGAVQPAHGCGCAAHAASLAQQ
jgi:hypothetical protein